ncbi:MAG: PDZ domain-containing protein [Crenarchaeota archaeon]|nr:PDZ domain-containing protein [Thermoproteota archaeon]
MSGYDENTVLNLIEEVTKSVVNISSVRLVQNFFYQTAPVSGMGSGTIIDAAMGLILTNSHVVGGAQRINITLWNNEVLEGKIVDSSSVHDIVVIQVNSNGKDLKAAELGDSDKLRVGQRVYAIGNPFGLTGGPSVTSGVVSAINRTIESKYGLIENLVQTDAAINPGNSGGPLIDTSGRIIAINTAIIPYAQGIGFAIPINAVKMYITDITTDGLGKQPWLGVVGLSLTSEISHYYDFPVDQGVIITKVSEGSPAKTAGMANGDIILEIDNNEVNNITDLIRIVNSKKVGEIIRIFVLRNSKQRFFELKLGSVS